MSLVALHAEGKDVTKDRRGLVFEWEKEGEQEVRRKGLAASET